MPRFADNPKIVPWPQFSGENTIDRAAIMLPRLYAKRLEEAGVDFSTIYPTLGFAMQTIPDDELRRVCCRAMNVMYADRFSGVREKMVSALQAFRPRNFCQHGSRYDSETGNQRGSLPNPGTRMGLRYACLSHARSADPRTSRSANSSNAARLTLRGRAG